MIPKYLYHYTTVEALKKILETKTIKFSRLDKLNDPVENELKDNTYGKLEFKKYVFCSCWSTKPDNIAMYYIYSQNKGVMIKAKSNIFGEIMLLMETKNNFMPVTPINGVETAYGQTTPKVIGPIKIEYVDTEEETYFNAISKEKENAEKKTLSLYELGNRKMKYWDYEQEWRFKLGISNASGINYDSKGSAYYLANAFVNVREEVFVPIFNQIEEIVTAPQMPEEEFQNLFEYVKKNYPEIKIRKSTAKSAFRL